MIPIAYNLRNLAVRRSTTIAAATGIALVVFVFASVLMFSEGMRKVVGKAAEPDVVVVLRQASTLESASAFDLAKVGVVLAMDAVARGPTGEPDGAAEVVAMMRLPKIGTSGLSMVQLRGIGSGTFRNRKNVAIVEGREPKPGTDEVIVGRGIRGRMEGLDVGQSIELGPSRRASVVGVFSDGGSALESEVWVDADAVRDVFGLEGIVSSIRVRLSNADKFDAFRAALQQNSDLGLEAVREGAYYERLSGGANALIQGVAMIIAVLFSVGAILGAMITMHASVANRRREIGTLRALGFGRAGILMSFLAESVFLALIGGVVGVAASLALSLVEFSFVNSANGAELAFGFQASPRTLAWSLVASVVMGAWGGLWPALRAARMTPLAGLRG